MTLDRWLLFNWMRWGRAMEYLKITYGWSLVLIVTFTVLYFRFLDAKAENRLEDGSIRRGYRMIRRALAWMRNPRSTEEKR